MTEEDLDKVFNHAAVYESDLPIYDAALFLRDERIAALDARARCLNILAEIQKDLYIDVTDSNVEDSLGRIRDVIRDGLKRGCL